MEKLTLEALATSAHDFCMQESGKYKRELYGVTDGKAVGTFVEHEFQNFLATRYDMDLGNSANGLDLPSINTDIKVTSIKQPQSSCPFKDSKQKIFGLGYNLIIFVYEKHDDTKRKKGMLITPPKVGYITISNALQWRLQYGRIVNLEEDIEGITKIIKYGII